MTGRVRGGRSFAFTSAVVGMLASALGAAVSCGSPYGSDAEPAPAAEGGSPIDAGADAVTTTACDGSRVASDTLHCGRCGHSCLGGACVGGVCQPFEIGRSSGELVLDVAVNATHVLWMTTTQPWDGPGHLYACPKSGCRDRPVSLAPEGAIVGSLAGDGITAFATFIYGSRGLQRVDTTTLSLLKQPAADNRAMVRVQIIQGAPYYLSLYEDPLTDGGKMSSARTLAGGVEKTIATIQGPENVSEYAPSGATTFFAFAGGIDAVTAMGRTRFSTETDGQIRLATNGTRLFWTRTADRTVRACEMTSTCASAESVLGPQQLADGTPLDIVSIGPALYVTTSTGKIITCAASSCVSTATTVVTEPRLYADQEFFFGHTVTADATAIYWSAVSATGTGDTKAAAFRIMKLAK